MVKFILFVKLFLTYGYSFFQIFLALRLFFLPNLPGPTLIPCPTSITDSRVFYRSGSSLVGSILSAKSTSTYLFEPYHWKHFNHKNGSKLDLHFVKVEEKFISDFTNGLFDCNKVRHFVFPKVFCYISKGLICTFFPFELYLSLSW